MVYGKVKEAVFINRPNRFIAEVLVDGRKETVHVKNTGRCRELLYKGAAVYLEESENKNRKTKYDLIGAVKGDMLINIDSQAPNKAFEEYLEKGSFFKDITYIKRECGYKNSRFDFYAEHGGKKSYIEVKGVTLEDRGVMLFPDAPTARGRKHLRELCECVQEGYEAYAVFVIQMDGGKYFTPNIERDPDFAAALCEAQRAGVKIVALNCEIKPYSMNIKEKIDVVMPKNL